MRGGGAGGLPAASGTGLAVPAETLTGSGYCGHSALGRPPKESGKEKQRLHHSGYFLETRIRLTSPYPQHTHLLGLEPIPDHSFPSLTSHFHNVPGDNVPGLDPLHRLAVGPVDFPHLGFVFFQSLNGILCITFLGVQGGGQEDHHKEEGCGGGGVCAECRDGGAGAGVLGAIGRSQRKRDAMPSWPLAQGRRQTPCEGPCACVE